MFGTARGHGASRLCPPTFSVPSPSDRSIRTPLLPQSRELVAAAQKGAQRTLRHRCAVAAQVFIIHRGLGRLPGFGFERDLRPEQDRGAEAGINVAVTESLFE